MSTSMTEHFAPVQDPRIDRNKRYPLMQILLVAACAVLSGADAWEAMEERGKAKLEWLRKFAPFANGVPTHDRIAEVISPLKPKTFQAWLRSWTRTVAKISDGELIAINGKTVRDSRDRCRAKPAPQP